MRIVEVAVAALVVSATGAQAQKLESGRTTGVALGWVEYAVRDQALNPLAHQGRLASLGLQREISDARTTRRFDAEIGAAALNSRFETGWSSLATDLRLAYRRAVEVARPDPELSVRLGGALDATSHMSYFSNWDDSHFYWLTAYSAGLDALVEHRRRDGARLSLEARLPLVAWVSRPEARIDYKVVNLEAGWIVRKLHEDLSLVSVDRHLALDVALRYQRPSGRWGRTLFWQFMYVRSDIETSAGLDLLRHTLGATIGL